MVRREWVEGKMVDILLLTKRDAWSGHAVDLAKIIFGDALTVYRGHRTDPFPEGLEWGEWDAIVSFLSPWIVPDHLLRRAPLAINFHPGSTDYPGIGCYNFALYEETKEYGVVCHHMLSTVDVGAIIAERRFPVMPGETVASLKLRSMVTMLALFHDICGLIAERRTLPASDHLWSRRPFTRRELDELCRVTPDMNQDEIRRRIRATTFPGFPGAFIEIGGARFEATASEASSGPVR